MMSSGTSTPQMAGGDASAPHAPDLFAFPVSSAQKRIWFLEQFRPGTPLNNLPIAARIQGPLDAALLELAINQIVRRHEILRTSFDFHNEQPTQVVAPGLTLPLPIVELGSLPAANRLGEALRLAAENARLPFVPTQLPLLRPRLLILSASEHILSLTAHQLVFDRWSVAMFFGELASIYERFRAGKPVDLPAPPIQYADFSVWQLQQLRALDRELAWWKRRLGGRLPKLDLPTDRPRPPVQTGRGAVESLTVPSALHAPLQELSQREDATLFITLLAAFLTLLHRYTGQDEILVGSPVAGRTRTETEDLIGPFTNTLVLRADLSGNPIFREMLRRVRETAVHAYTHEDVRFESLLEELQPERSLSHSPLFQVMFALERAPLESVHWPRIKLTELPVDTGTARFDLSLHMIESACGLAAQMEYNTDLFDAKTIQSMLAHFSVLLQEIAADPGRRLSDLPLLTPDERHKFFSDWNRIEVAYPRESGLHELIERQAARSPDADAVLGEQTLTYRQLDQNANQLARHLQSLGLPPEAPVGLCLERSPEMIVGLLAILKAGGAFLALDPTDPRDRLAFMLEDSSAPLVITAHPLAHNLPRRGPRLLCLDSEGKIIARQSREKPATAVQPDNLAYVVYTSGPAGKPKGVLITHRAVVNLLHSMRREPGVSATDALLAITSASFDSAVLELFLPLTVGARVILATGEEAADGARLAAKISAAGITILQGTAATWRALLDSGWRGHQGLRLLSGGEPAPRAFANRLLDRCGELWNLYGQAETTVWSAATRIEPGSDPVTIGRPIANTEFFILDRYLQPVPAGVPGELVIGGDGLARGYLNRPELTAERFIRHPFSDDPAARVYRTGDRARWLPDGNIEWLGRTDHQVRIRGLRIEPGEIEATLLQFPTVREAVVVAREDTPGDRRLVAYLTSYRNTTASINELRRFARDRLPAYMLPSAFVLLDQLPLAKDGAVDRGAFCAPDDHPPGPETGPRATPASVEQTIATVWEAVLSVKNPGINDSFFDLGGRSLQVVQVRNRLRESFGIHLPLIRFFEFPTIRSLAACLAGAGKKEEPLQQRILERTRRKQTFTAPAKPFGARVKL